MAAALGSPVNTAWGEITATQAAQLCRAQHVFIGTIESAVPFVGNVGEHAGRVHSTVVWNVERNLRGTPSPFTMDQPGGFVGERAHLLGGFPIPSPGRRYLMVVELRPSAFSGFEAGSLWFKFAIPLDPEDSLPPEEDLRAALDETCGE